MVIATYNHPRSYSGPEIMAILTPRNGVIAPIHLMVTQTQLQSVGSILSRYCSRRIVVHENSCVKIFEVRLSASDLIGHRTILYLDRLQKMICICSSYRAVSQHVQREKQVSTPKTTRLHQETGVVKVRRTTREIRWEKAYHPRTVVHAWKPPSGGSDSKGDKEPDDSSYSRSSFSFVANTSWFLDCVKDIKNGGWGWYNSTIWHCKL